ncbi:MAG: cysteine desulfurase [Myxococcales bacterium]|nr:MAG: cysteine desulfurase [Myxococcales bacterium]
MTPSTPTANLHPESRAKKNWDKVRADFPALDQEVHGKALCYLDSAATALKPQAVIDSVLNVYAKDCANIHRGVHMLSQRATVAYEKARDTVKRFLNAPQGSHSVFVRGTTEAINLVAQSFVAPQLKAGDEILITELEHHSNLVPWWLLCKNTGAKLVVLPFDDKGQVDPAEFEAKLSEKTRFVSLCHVSNALGTVLPVKAMIDAAHARGLPVLLDGAQALPHLPVDLSALDADFYAFSAHKAYGPTGSGVLVAKTRWLEQMQPYQSGGDMIKSVSFSEVIFNDLPHRFEAGTPNIAGVIGMGAALEYLEKLGMQTVFEHEQALLTYAHEKLKAIPNVRLVGQAAQKVGVVSVVLEGIHPHDIGTVLDMDGVAIRAGHHCAQPVMEHFGVPATVRASFGIYNTESDVDRFIDGLQHAQELLG